MARLTIAGVILRHLLLLCLLGLTALSHSATVPSVPGCPELDGIDELQLPEGGSIDELLLCFCQRKPITASTVSIFCLYGSSIEHLQKAAAAVHKANLTVEQLSIQHMEFPEDGINKELLQTVAPKLARLDVRECAGSNSLAIHSDAFTGLETTLVNVTLHDCKLKEVPAAFDSLNMLRSLVLSSNDIEMLHKKSFAGKKALRYLDLSGNMINEVEDETFMDLEDLESLLIGDHNYLNDSLVAEIGRLTSLEVLDLSRADGVFAPPEGLFPSLPMLKVLKLAGCSVSSIEPGAFAPLGQLEQLDLRVNLIENVSALAFDGLTSLRRLSLAGNYIREVESDHWAGLASLETLDLGWNELKQLDPDAFAAVSPSLTELDLRHNPLKEFPPLALPELKIINLSETNITKLDASTLEELPKLEVVELLRCNVTTLSPDTFSHQKNTLKKLVLTGNKLRDIPLLLESLPELEELSVAHNPLLCDNRLSNFITSVNSAYQKAAEQGRAFLLSSANDTTCGRPWSLRGQPIFELTDEQLVPYDETMDTTTAQATTTTEAASETQPDTTQILQTLPNFLIGKESGNVSIFTDDRARVQYDLASTDEAKNPSETSQVAIMATVGIITIVTVIALIAVIFFVKKHRQVSPTGRKNSIEKRKPSEEMEEIELGISGGYVNHAKR